MVLAATRAHHRPMPTRVASVLAAITALETYGAVYLLARSFVWERPRPSATGWSGWVPPSDAPLEHGRGCRRLGHPPRRSRYQRHRLVRLRCVAGEQALPAPPGRSVPRADVPNASSCWHRRQRPGNVVRVSDGRWFDPEITKRSFVTAVVWSAAVTAALVGTLSSLGTDEFDGLNNMAQIPLALPWFLVPIGGIWSHGADAWIVAGMGWVNALLLLLYGECLLNRLRGTGP